MNWLVPTPHPLPQAALPPIRPLVKRKPNFAKMLPALRKCKQCGKEFRPYRHSHSFCSKPCNDKHKYLLWVADRPMEAEA